MRLIGVIAGLLLSALTQAATLEIKVQHPVMDSVGKRLLGDRALIDWRAEYGTCAEPFVPLASRVRPIAATVVTFTAAEYRQYCARIVWRNKIGEVRSVPAMLHPRAGAITSFTVSP